MKDFALKFIDIMIGIVLGLGFQWWDNLHEPWQYIAFFFAYLSVIDYWIDYNPVVKKFPPKNELSLITDVGVLFSMFLLIYSAQKTLAYFFIAFAVFRIADIFWLLRVKHDFTLPKSEKIYFDTWIIFELIEAIVAIGLLIAFQYPPLMVILVFIIFRIGMRVAASFRYKSVHFA